MCIFTRVHILRHKDYSAISVEKNWGKAGQAARISCAKVLRSEELCTFC